MMCSLLVVTVLADETPRNTGPDFGKASPFGLLITVLLLVGVFLLVRSMNRHLKRLPESFDRDEAAADQADEAARRPEPPQESGGQSAG